MISVRGSSVTFLPPKGATGLIGDFTDWKKRPPLSVPDTGLTLTFPRGAWIEYAWINEAGEAFADPENDQKSLNPWWNYPRAAILEGYTEHSLWQAPEATTRGVTHRLSWEGEVWEGKRRALVHVPNGCPFHAPIYYIQDGVAFYRTGKLAELVDKAVEAGLIEPIVLVFVEPLDRNKEYYLNDEYLTFLQREVFPRVEGVYANPSVRGLWGASLGGLISLYLGSKHPELFGRVVSHSGAFIASPEGFSSTNTTTAGEWLLAELKKNPPHHLHTSLDTGVLEWLTGANRRMSAFFADEGLPHQYREYPSGHNWITWRQALAEALLYTAEQ